jgi:cobyric acid synthase CobQ
MFQGTGSDVGKSIVVAGICRALARKGLRVRPFKPQNMSNNAAITVDGGEIGRAQALQARACGTEPTVEMNPVLLKPESDRGSQVVVRGRVRATVQAEEYLEYRKTLMPDVLESFQSLCDEADIVVVEGAGSISEVNLRDGDIANMGFAVAADVPVVLLADLDRGGALASIVGSHALIPDRERKLLHGYIMNKFRGAYKVLEPAIDIIREHTGLPCYGVLRWFPQAARLPAEDSQALTRRGEGDAKGGRRIKIYVLGLSRIANFDDFDPLAAEPDVDLTFVKPGSAIPGDADLVIVPGTKSTIGDLDFLRQQGWDIDILAHLRRGGKIAGICGGYQILGRKISDPLALENDTPTAADGLGLLNVETVLEPEKMLRRFTARNDEGIEISGYEIHMGRTTGPDTKTPMLELDGVPEGAFSPSKQVCGCYIHGLFTSDAFRRKFLAAFRDGSGIGGESLDYNAVVDQTLDLLADHVEKFVDMHSLTHIAGLDL